MDDNPLEQLGETALSLSSSAVTHLLSSASIPTPILKNAFKAFAQLCTAAVEVPMAHLESIAAEKRAETKARVKLINKSAAQIASGMELDPDFAIAAAQKFGQRILRQQSNLNKVCEVAAAAISQNNSESDQSKVTNEQPDISSDWLNNFENQASQKSTEEMQMLFGKILAGEINNPTSFSIKTVNIVGQLDTIGATLFKRLRSMCIVMAKGNRIFDARVSALDGYAGLNNLKPYGIKYNDLNLLNELGLIIADYNSAMDYKDCVANPNRVVPISFYYQGQECGLLSTSEKPFDRNFNVHGVCLSHAGRELIKVVDNEPNKEYTQALKVYFANHGYVVMQVNGRSSEL